jgi:hypothetical protein
VLLHLYCSYYYSLKVHKNDNFFGSDFDFDFNFNFYFCYNLRNLNWIASFDIPSIIIIIL